MLYTKFYNQTNACDVLTLVLRCERNTGTVYVVYNYEKLKGERKEGEDIILS